jgi:hypothetical protein
VSPPPAARAPAPVPVPAPGAAAPSKVPRKESAPPVAAKPPAPPALDLAALEKRLRDTEAIGIFTKLSLKNQVDDLVARFRAFHQGAAVAVTKLREEYDLLLLKVLSVLQDGDPGLARDIAASREAIWGLLVDPVKFRNVT